MPKRKTEEMSEEEKFQRQIQNVLEAKTLTSEMRQTLKQWHQSLHNIKVRTQLGYLGIVKKFGEYLSEHGKERYEDAEKKDVDSYLSTVKKESTHNNVLIVIKRFHNDIEKPEVVKHLKAKSKDLRPIPPSQLLTPDEVVELASATGDQEYKTAILTLYECAARVEVEVLKLRLGDVVFSSVRDKDENHLLIATTHFGNSKGDLKKEPVTLSMFASELKAWVENHPFKGDEQAWLFPSKRNPKKPMSYMTIWSILRKAKKRTGINKKVNPHWLRHSSLSYCANELNYNEQLLMWRAGWKNTGMAKRYIHSGGDLERKAYLERQGYVVEEKKREIPKAKPCPHCNHLNPYTNNACDLCGMPLDVEKYKKVLESRRHPEDIEKIDELTEKVERLERIVKALAETRRPKVQEEKQRLIEMMLSSREEENPHPKSNGLRLPK